MLRNRHCADHELLMTADADPRDRRRAARHLEHCAECQRRRDLLEQSLEELTDASRGSDLFALPPAAGARARLQQQMRELAVAPSFPSWLLPVGSWPRWAHAAAVMLLIAVTGWGQASDKARATAAGFDLHFTKPVEPQRLIKLLGGELPTR